MEKVLIVMVVAGAFGGLANWLLNSAQSSLSMDGAAEQDIAKNDTIMLGLPGYIIVGVVASFTVPLFLSLAQSKLLQDALEDTKVVEKLILAGFCILAAFSSRAFMTSISDTVLKEVRNARQKAEVAQAVAADAEASAKGAQAAAETIKHAVVETELRIEEIEDNVREPLASGRVAATESPGASTFDISLLSTDETKVLKAATRMSLRTTQGLAKDSGIPKVRVGETIDELQKKGLLERTKSPNTGSLRYRLTDDGIDASDALRIST